MSVRRKEIRKGVQAILKAANSDAGLANGVGLKIFSNLSTAVWSEDLPQVAIFSRNEVVEEYAKAPREYKRNLELAIEIMAAAPEDPNAADGTFLEDLLDDIAEEIETELNRDETVGELAKLFGNSCKLVDELLLTNVEFEYSGEGSKPTGSCRLIYNVVYHEFRPALIDQQGITDDLEEVNVEWFVGHDNDAPDSVIEATDEIAIPTS